MRSLVRLKALQAFEASARYGSFSGAAAELQVTAAAIGQLVRSLETWLGAPVFERRGSGRQRLVPMPDARSAIRDLTEGLDSVEAGLTKLRHRRGRTAITVTASQALVAKWLLLRLEDFNRRCPGIDVRLDVTDRPVDLERGEADVAVRCGAGTWPGLWATRLMGEEVFPVCNPGLPGGAAHDRAWLLGQVLIHDLLAPPDVFPTWDEWLARAGWASRARGALRINASAVVIEAAGVRSGRGTREKGFGRARSCGRPPGAAVSGHLLARRLGLLRRDHAPCRQTAGGFAVHGLADRHPRRDTAR